MKAGPDISRIASLIGDPARANMLSALLDGRALTASELAAEAGVTKQTASAHLSKLVGASLLKPLQQGRCRYFRIDDADVAAAMESLACVAAKRGGRTRTGPKEPALRKARICYDHLAGDMGVALCDGLLAKRWLKADGDDLLITRAGRARLSEYGIDLCALETGRRALCRPCLDWSVRRRHLAGALGAALMTSFLEKRWARRVSGTRVIAFSPAGERAFQKAFAA